MVDPTHSFHLADYAVFGVTIFISLGIGIFYAFAGGGQKTTSEYLVGGRQMKFLPVAISLMVSFESSIMMLGLPAEMYVYGVQWWLSCLGYLVSQFLSVAIMVPLLHPLKITSAYEYLQKRFNSTAVRLLGSCLGMLSYVWYMGIVLFGPAIALEAVTGFPQWGSIFVVAGVAIIYTSIGGLKAVIWTDVFQAFIMYAGMLAILIKGTIDVGGPTRVWEVAREGGRLNLFNFDFDPTVRHTFWSLFIGSIIRGFGLAFNQSTVQRVSSTSSLRDAKKMMLFMAPCFFISLSMACYEGIVAFAYYSTKGCDPLASKKITNPNQIIPFTVMDIFMSLPGMPGLFLASLFSASLSTLSSGLSSLSALLWADILKPRMGPVSELKATIIAKVSVVVFGGLGCGVAVLVSLIGGPLTQIATTLLGAFSGPLTGLFLLGCFNPYANAKGALYGGLLSLVYSCWLSMGKVFASNVKREPWLPPASVEMCLANHSAALMDATTSAAPSGGIIDGITDTVLGLSGLDGGEFDSGVYSTVSSFFPTTADPGIVDAGPQGIEKMYTLSYMWITPACILLTIFLGSLISIITGGNKKGEVDPRYLISVCDNLCCCLPKSVRDIFGCGEDYNTVKSSELPPLHDVFVDKEMTIPDPSHDAAFSAETQPMITVNDVDKSASGTDVGKLQDEDQNGGSYVRYSAPAAGDNDVVDIGKTNAEEESRVDGNRPDGNGQLKE